MKRTVFLIFFFISANYLFGQEVEAGFGIRFANSIGNSSQNEMADIGSFIQTGIKIGSEDVFFSLLSDFRFFGFPQVTGGLITGINFPVDSFLLSFSAGGGFSNPKFTTIFDSDSCQPYIRGMFFGGKDNGWFVLSIGIFFDYYFDSKELYDHNFRTGLLLSVGNM
jgi:hypothetical protein